MPTAVEPDEARGLTKGVASRKAVAAALSAHVKVLKGSPLRRATSEALRAQEGLGGKERRFVAWATRELSRHQRRIELSARTRGIKSSALQLAEDRALVHYVIWRLELTRADPTKVLAEVALPGPIRPRSLPDAVIAAKLVAPIELDLGEGPLEVLANRHSFPTWLITALDAACPPGELEPLLEALNRDPPLWLRARPAGEVADIVASLRGQQIPLQYPTPFTAEVPEAVRVDSDGRAVFESRAMKQGQLEVMDIGSQRLVKLAGLEPGMTVVDYCAGAGTKTLAIADAVGPSGKVFAHDLSPSRLAEARRRAAELKLRHVSFPKPPRIDLADVVVVDAPCSGTGTLGREPQVKWSLTAAQVQGHGRLQREILGQVWPAMRKGARLLYATCSVLPAENEEVVSSFLAAHPGATAGPTLRQWPHHAGGGGFFGAVLTKG